MYFAVLKQFSGICIPIVFVFFLQNQMKFSEAVRDKGGFGGWSPVDIRHKANRRGFGTTKKVRGSGVVRLIQVRHIANSLNIIYNNRGTGPALYVQKAG